MKDSLARDTAAKAHDRISKHAESIIALRAKNAELEQKVAHHEKVLNLLFTHLGLEVHTIPEVPAVPAIPAHLGLRKATVRDENGRFTSK